MAIEYPGNFWKDYELIDSGNGEKLERFGSYVLRRPEPKALWTPTLPESEWRRMAYTHFHPGAGFGKAGKEDTGTWESLRQMDDQWQIRYPGGPKFSLRLGMTAFKHVGVFPEQAPNWEFIYSAVRSLVSDRSSAPRNAGCAGPTASGSPSYDAEGGTVSGGGTPVGKAAGNTAGARPKVLNLFAYTGAASLAAAAAGAEVTHLDSVRQVVNWASDNAERSRIDGIHWVVEDAMKFARREQKRGHRYSGIILDPPAYGHGPDGEKWKLDECLFDMLRTVSGILEPKNSFMVLNLYSNGYSPLLGETIVKEAFGLKDRRFHIESGELSLCDRFGKALPLSIVVRLTL